jgi:hypothetical protein
MCPTRPVVLILPFLLMFCAACAQTRIVEKPVPVPVETVRYLPVPADLTTRRPATDIPATLTFREALILWTSDRTRLQMLNTQLQAIANLEVGDNGNQ